MRKINLAAFSLILLVVTNFSFAGNSKLTTQEANSTNFTYSGVESNYYCYYSTPTSTDSWTLTILGFGNEGGYSAYVTYTVSTFGGSYTVPWTATSFPITIVTGYGHSVSNIGIKLVDNISVPPTKDVTFKVPSCN